ncbi:MAG TPA: ferritin-like protein, partial [Kofleriaceae bacterium]
MDTSEAPIRIEHREALAYLLTEAAEIEHGLMGCYLYAAWSLGARDPNRPHGEAIERWRKVILEVAFDEMQHLACVANLSNAIGATPHYQRNNYPVAPGYHPAGVVVSLAPFNLATMEHFVYLERPEGSADPDGPGFVSPSSYARGGREDRLVPGAHDYKTVGHLYRGIEAGLAHLAEKLGEANLFDGDPRLQLDGKLLSMPAVTPITDVASARIAIEAIVAQGEGAADCPEGSHYMRFVGVRNELRAILAKEPDFDPAAHRATNPVMRKPPVSEGRLWIDAEPAASVLDVGNALYAFMLRGLGTLTSPVALDPIARSLALQCALQGMRVMSPLGELLADLPASTTNPECRAGLTFTMSRSVTPMPEPRGALRALHENAAS